MSSTAYSQHQTDVSRDLADAVYEFIAKWQVRRAKVNLFIEGLKRKVWRAKFGDASWNGVSEFKKEIIDWIAKEEIEYRHDRVDVEMAFAKANASLLDNESGEFLKGAIERCGVAYGEMGKNFYMEEVDRIDELAAKRAATPTVGTVGAAKAAAGSK